MRAYVHLTSAVLWLVLAAGAWFGAYKPTRGVVALMCVLLAVYASLQFLEAWVGAA